MQATENLWESPFWPDRRFAEKMRKPAGQMNVDPEQDKCTAIDYGTSPWGILCIVLRYEFSSSGHQLNVHRTREQVGAM